MCQGGDITLRIMLINPFGNIEEGACILDRTETNNLEEVNRQ